MPSLLKIFLTFETFHCYSHRPVGLFATSLTDFVCHSEIFTFIRKSVNISPQLLYLVQIILTLLVILHYFRMFTSMYVYYIQFPLNDVLYLKLTQIQFVFGEPVHHKTLY